MATTKKDLKLFDTSMDIPQDARVKIINVLNQTLAEVFDLYSQTKQAHWNVKGPYFIQLHEFYDRIAEMIFPYVDEVAERVTALGGFATGTARMAANSSTLKEFPDIHGGMETVKALAERYASLTNTCRENVDKTEKWGDMATSDLYVEIVRVLDKALWFLEAHIQG
jgi:starvation-inducible DNA-binding protein